MFRTLGKSKIAFVLAILFGISLFFFRGGSRYSNIFNSDSVVAKVSGTSISTSKFNRTMQMNITKFNQMLNKQMTGDEIRNFQIHSLALGALINDAVFEDEYDLINFKIDEQVIALKTKERIPELYDANNKLNELFLNTFLQQNQLQIEDVVQIINYETRDNYFNEAFFNINYSEYFNKKINKFNNHKRKITYTEIDFDKINIDLTSAPKTELESYYNKNIINYMSDEKRNIDFLLLDKNSFKENFKPSISEIEKYFNSNNEIFFQNEQRTFIQFNFKTIEEANNFKKITEDLNTEETIKYSKNNNIRFNEFENLEENEVLKEIANPLFKLNINQKSEVFKTSLANHIIILQSIKPSYQQSLGEVKEEIISTITNIDTDNYYNDLLNKISKNILNGSSITEVANNFNLEIDNLKEITRDYDKYDKSDELLFSNIIISSFESNKDFVSDIINVSKNLAYIINVNEILLPEPINFKEVESIVLEDWKRVKRIELFKSKIKDNEENSMYIADIANKYESDVIELIISKSSKDIPQNINQQIFGSEKNINIQSFYNSKFYLAKVDDIIMDNENNSLSAISLNDDLRASFSAEINKNKKIKTNDSLISALIEQY